MQDKELHLRLEGMDIRNPDKVQLHVVVEEGGTLTDLRGKPVWSGFVTIESVTETITAAHVALAVGDNDINPQQRRMLLAGEEIITILSSPKYGLTISEIATVMGRLAASLAGALGQVSSEVWEA